MSKFMAFTTLFGTAMLASTAMSLAAGQLTDSKGMTLYTYDKDKGAMSSCDGDCAVKWPPYLVQKTDKMGKDWSETKRADGTKQFTYKSSPVYFYVEDRKAGDKLGDGMGNAWHVIPN